jgi:hypothetical protein
MPRDQHRIMTAHHKVRMTTGSRGRNVLSSREAAAELEALEERQVRLITCVSELAMIEADRDDDFFPVASRYETGGGGSDRPAGRTSARVCPFIWFERPPKPRVRRLM